MCPGVAVQFNLHSVWDNCIIEKKIGLDYAGIAAKLRAEFTDEDRARWIPSIIDTAAVVAWAIRHRRKTGCAILRAEGRCLLVFHGSRAVQRHSKNCHDR
jgi:hypothetical protein